MPRAMTATTIGLFGLLVLGAGASALAQEKAQPVGVFTVVKREVATGEARVGTVIPTRRATVGSAVDGRVVKYPIEIGDRVEAGQPLAQILTDTVELKLAEAKAELELRQQELRELENGARPEEIEQARAQLKSAQATNEYNQARLERTRTLYERGGVTEATLDEVRSLALASAQAVLEAQANYDLVLAGPRAEQIAQAQAQVAMQDAVVQQLKDQLAKHTVRTQFTGYVVAESTEAGAWLSPGDPIAEIAALDKVDIRVHVAADAIAYVKLGDDVHVDVPALPKTLFTGTVIAVNPQGNTTTRTFPVLIRVSNETRDGVPLLKAGMVAHVVLPSGPRQKAVMIPKDAIVLGHQRPIIFVLEESAEDESPTVKAVPVRLGVADGYLIQAIGDVRAGQKIVALGNENLSDGDAVRITKTVTYDEGAPREAADASPPDTP